MLYQGRTRRLAQVDSHHPEASEREKSYEKAHWKKLPSL
jgi:hypothetical protein